MKDTLRLIKWWWGRRDMPERVLLSCLFSIILIFTGAAFSSDILLIVGLVYIVLNLSTAAIISFIKYVKFQKTLFESEQEDVFRRLRGEVDR